MADPFKLVVKDLAVERGGRPVIEGLSFEVAAGEALIVVGPNGAGKTTLLRTIAGFIAPQYGSISLESPKTADTAPDDDRPIVEHCHVIGHLNGVKSALTVAENLSFAAVFLGTASRSGPQSNKHPVDRITSAIDRLGLTGLSDIPAELLSAGQKRRLCLARLLVADRPIWLLDEPTVSLDVASAGLVAGLIDDHIATGGLAIIVTHVPLGLKSARELLIGRQQSAANLPPDSTMSDAAAW